jgi:hypothetical protein
MGNRFQIELDKIQVSCNQCEHVNCQQCALNFRKLEFQWAIKGLEDKAKERAKARREQPLKAHARFV